MIMELFLNNESPNCTTRSFHLDDVTTTLDINSRMVDWQKLYLLQVPEAPEQNFQSVLYQFWPDGGRDGQNWPEV